MRRRAQTAPFRHVAAPGMCGATPRQAAGHYEKRLNWANALEQPPARLRGGLRECILAEAAEITEKVVNDKIAMVNVGKKLAL